MPTDKPRVSLNLDTLKDETTRAPFVVVLDGKPYEFANPGDLGWQELEDAQEAMDRGRLKPMLRLALGEEKFDAFVAKDFPARKIGRVVRDWQRHYGQADPGEGDASSTS